MDWETYYERFYEWAESTQISRISDLESFGTSDEIAEVVQNIWNEAAASRLVKNALAAGVRFTADEVFDLREYVNQETLQQMCRSAETAFTEEQAEDMDGWVDADTYDLICPQVNEPEHAKSSNVYRHGRKVVLGAVALSLLFGLGKKKKHNGRCNGDCANCPPHYGYRYGRWYYGHDHAHGCEFGGNKCSGSMD